jgi:hypothetical protein
MDGQTPELVVSAEGPLAQLKSPLLTSQLSGFEEKPLKLC